MATTGPRAQKRLHDWVDERGRALDAAVAEKLRITPELISHAIENVDRCIAALPAPEERRTHVARVAARLAREAASQ